MDKKTPLITQPQSTLKQCRHGYMLFYNNDQFIGRSLDLYGEYSEEEIELFNLIIKPGNTVLDLGANIGIHTLGLAKMVGEHGHVYAYEPQRLVYNQLCANIALNECNNTHCIQAAISNQPQTIFVPILDLNQPNNIGGVTLEQQAGNHTEAVIALTIDEQHLPACDFMKIDIEGMELEALQGARKTIEKFQPILYLENDRIDKGEALTRFIAHELGYKILWHTPFLYNANNFYENKDNIFPNMISKNLLCIPEGKTVHLPGYKLGKLDINAPADKGVVFEWCDTVLRKID